MTNVRADIIATYAQWTALSALRSGAPIKSRHDVYTSLRDVDFEVLFDDSLGPINRSTFDAWHQAQVSPVSTVKRQP